MLAEIVEAAREVQLPLLAVLLLAGAATKATKRAASTGPAVLVRERLRRPITAATGLVEAALAVGLVALTGVLGEAAKVLTAAVFAASVVVLVLVRRRAPEAGCGCFGGLSRTPVGWRTLARPGLLAAAAVAALGLEPAGWQVVASFTPVHAGVLGVELLVLAALSPELRDLAARARHREPCELRRYSLRRTRARLRRSEVWRATKPVVLKDAPEDLWRHGCWRFLRYDGMRYGQRMDVVYAVRIGGRRRTAVRAALVDRRSGAVVATFGEVTRHELPGPPRRLLRPSVAAKRDEARRGAGKAERTLQAAQRNRSGEPGRGLDTGQPV